MVRELRELGAGALPLAPESGRGDCARARSFGDGGGGEPELVQQRPKLERCGRAERPHPGAAGAPRTCHPAVAPARPVPLGPAEPSRRLAWWWCVWWFPCGAREPGCFSGSCVWPAWWRWSHQSFISLMQERLHLHGPPPKLLDIRAWGFQASAPRKPQEARPGGGTCQPKRGSGWGWGGGGVPGYSSPASRVSCWKDERGSSSPPFKSLSVTNFSGYFLLPPSHRDLGASLWSLAQGTVGWVRTG